MSGLCRFRPADVACLLSASNRRADIVRATQHAGVAQWQSRRFVSVRPKVRFRSVSTSVSSESWHVVLARTAKRPGQLPGDRREPSLSLQARWEAGNRLPHLEPQAARPIG